MFFKDVIGQKEVKQRLLLEVRENRIPHAQLFCGPEGSGKLALAIAYARYINCQHPNAAKLLVRFIMGGMDGDTSGNDPFNTLGGWPVRDDITPAEGSIPLEEWNLLQVDTSDIYYNINNVRDFWTLLG